MGRFVNDGKLYFLIDVRLIARNVLDNKLFTIKSFIINVPETCVRDCSGNTFCNLLQKDWNEKPNPPKRETP